VPVLVSRLLDEAIDLVAPVTVPDIAQLPSSRPDAVAELPARIVMVSVGRSKVHGQSLDRCPCPSGGKCACASVGVLLADDRGQSITQCGI